MIRVFERLCTLLLICATSCGVALTVFVALSAIMRYVLGSPFAFTEELVGLLFSALVFLALPYVSVQRSHISIGLMTDRYSPALQRLALIVSNLLVLLFCIWFGYYAFDFTQFSYQLGARTDLAGIRMWPWMGLMVLASVLMGLVALLFLYHNKMRPADRDPIELTEGH